MGIDLEIYDLADVHVDYCATNDIASLFFIALIGNNKPTFKHHMEHRNWTKECIDFKWLPLMQFDILFQL